MTTVRRRKAKPRRYSDVSIVVPDAREHLIADEYEYMVDPRTDPPTLHRDLLDPLEAGEPVEVQAWELPGDRDEIVRTFGGLYARVRVDRGDLVTVVAPVANALDLPGES